MKTSPFRTSWAVASIVICALTMLVLASPSQAQQKAAPALSQPQQPAVPSQAAPVLQQSPAPAATVPPASAPDATAGSSETRSVKSTAAALRELSPWSMFKSADILVQAVMVGLAFASLVTWTIFIAKIIELSVIQRKLRSALTRIADARSLAEAQFALGAKDSVLSALLGAAMREAR